MPSEIKMGFDPKLAVLGLKKVLNEVLENLNMLYKMDKTKRIEYIESINERILECVCKWNYMIFKDVSGELHVAHTKHLRICHIPRTMGCSCRLFLLKIDADKVCIESIDFQTITLSNLPPRKNGGKNDK